MNLLLPLAFLALAAATQRVADDSTPIVCDSCAQWNEAIAPFRLHDDVYYVGTRGLAVVLIDTGQGLILLDGALPQSAQRILVNIRALGFEPRDVRWIVNSHEHYDHAGGIAALARLTGARVAASPRGAEGLRQGNASKDDPQAGFGDAMRFPAVRDVRAMVDGEAIELGRVKLTAHHTPGHTPGATTWTWRSCELATRRCLDFVFADSLNPVSAPGFRYTGDVARVRAFESSIAKLRALPCDALIPLHPEFGAASGDADDFIGKHKCAAFATRVNSRWRQRLREEASSSKRGRNQFSSPPRSDTR